MLVLLGFTMILVFMALIMTKLLTPMVALIVVPTIFGLFAGAGLGIGDMVMKAIGSLAPTAALLMFAIMYFGIMIDVGLFDPLIRIIVRTLGNDPAKVALGTALLAGAVSLDGDGSTTFIVTTAAMLPIYVRLGMSPVVLTCIAGLTNGTLNIVPWGGPTVRAAAALQVSPSDIFVPMLPSLAVGLILTLVFTWFLGLGERRRLGSLTLGTPLHEITGACPLTGGPIVPRPGIGAVARRYFPLLRNPQTQGRTQVAVANSVATDRPDSTLSETMLSPARETLRPKLIWVNLVLTLIVMALIVTETLPLPFVFMAGSAIALLINFPTMKEQTSAIVAHAPSIVGVVSMVLAAGVLIGVLNGTGMVEAMAKWIVAVIPSAFGPFFAVITGILSVPMTFFMSNDAFYYGVLPVLSESAGNYGISPLEMARASITGQPVHLQSPLVPAILLLVSLSAVNLGDHHRRVLWRAAMVSLVMLIVGVLVGSIPFG
ncbi:CitMHS family transporter [Rathayibacter toxicus]